MYSISCVHTCRTEPVGIVDIIGAVADEVDIVEVAVLAPIEEIAEETAVLAGDVTNNEAPAVVVDVEVLVSDDTTEVVVTGVTGVDIEVETRFNAKSDTFY